MVSLFACGGQLKGKGKGLAHRDISLHVRDIQKFEQQAPGASWVVSFFVSGISLCGVKQSKIMGHANCNLHGWDKNSRSWEVGFPRKTCRILNRLRKMIQDFLGDGWLHHKGSHFSHADVCRIFVYFSHYINNCSIKTWDQPLERNLIYCTRWCQILFIFTPLLEGSNLTFSDGLVQPPFLVMSNQWICGVLPV